MSYLTKLNEWPYEVELLVDWKIFKEQVVLKAMYELVDKVYMFIKKDWDDYKILFKLKPDIKEEIEDIVNSFWEELVFHRLRYDLDKKYWKLKEKIIETALGFWLSLDDLKQDLDEIMDKIKELPINQWNNNTSDIDQPKSIDDIIAEIENDPDFQDDKDEIISILKEIEEEESKEDESK